jgi:hypothetical protein
MMRKILVLLALWMATQTALAHKASDSYLTLQVQGTQVSGHWDIALRDIDFAIGLDADGNNEITWGEVKARHADIDAWALSSLNLQRGGTCHLQVTRHLVDEHTDGHYTVLELQGECPSAMGELEMQYRLLFSIDALHRGLLQLTLDGYTQASIFGPETTAQQFANAPPSLLQQLRKYVIEGVWHIWLGYDHILFLLSLLLPAVLVHTAQGWRGAARIGDASKEVLWVVTAFTAAHSITLSLAALGYINLPSRLVESTIAFSIIVAALNNLWPVVTDRRWSVAFCFGLIHGFGFASVLADLKLPQDALAVSLLGFNLGVEAGQLVIVTAFLPLAFVLRNSHIYRRAVFVGGSVLTIALATIWFVERAFNLRLLSA